MSGADAIVLGIDARAAAEVPGGRGRVVRELLRALAVREDDVRYVLYARRRWETQLDARFRWRLLDAPEPLWHLRAARAAGREADAFLSSNSYLTVWFLRIPSVAIVYDLIPFEPAMRPNLRSTIVERLTLGPAVKRARALLCISEATAAALISRFPAAAGKTAVAALGTSLPEQAGLDRRELDALPPPGFVLAVGTLEPRKNLPRLAAAYARLKPEVQARHPLVVVGPSGWEEAQTLSALRALGERCVLLGHVSDAALAELYRRCAVFCYPSLGEGFGLPVLEAMAQGAAVLTSNVSSLPEVGGQAVAYADPLDVDSIEAGLAALLGDAQRRRQLGARARERSLEFSWERFAQDTLATLLDAAGVRA